MWNLCTCDLILQLQQHRMEFWSLMHTHTSHENPVTKAIVVVFNVYLGTHQMQGSVAQNNFKFFIWLSLSQAWWTAPLTIWSSALKTVCMLLFMLLCFFWKINWLKACQTNYFKFSTKTKKYLCVISKHVKFETKQKCVRKLKEQRRGICRVLFSSYTAIGQWKWVLQNPLSVLMIVVLKLSMLFKCLCLKPVP